MNSFHIADEGVRELHCKVAKLESDLDLLIRSANWVVWSAIVRLETPEEPWFDWDFQPDFNEVVPPWLDVQLNPGEWLTHAFSRLRVQEDNGECDDRAVQALRAGASGYHQIFRLQNRSGGVTWVEETVSIYPHTPGYSRLIGVCIDANERMQREEDLHTLHDQVMAQNTELVERDRLREERMALLETNARLEDLALTDELTAVRNLRGFRDRLNATWYAAVERHTPVSLIILDIDHFKEYNDRHGHPAGDKILRQICDILRETAREGDCIARYGGEEFAVILPGVRTLGATSIAERFRAAIEKACWPLQPITASFGVATMVRPSGNAQKLIDDSDRALYKAKGAGRNRVCHASHLAAARAKGGGGRPRWTKATSTPHPVVLEPSKKTSFSAASASAYN